MSEGHQSVHVPVLVTEVLSALNVRAGGTYLDATCGPGGHVAALLDRLGPQGRVLALDRDPDAAETARLRFTADHRVSVSEGAFSILAACVERHRLSGHLDGVLFDLGLSSVQLEDPLRGFSFQREGPLDMRFDPSHGVSAARWLRTVSERVLASVLRDLGEERYAKRIARAIVHARGRKPIETTSQLAALVASAVPSRERGKHPATRAFLAIRLSLNRELEELQTALPQAVSALAPGGRLVVISFHSLEDRIVKRFMRAQASGTVDAPGAPAMEFTPTLRLIGKALRPGTDEVRHNPRARSAVLRVAERTEVAHA